MGHEADGERVECIETYQKSVKFEPSVFQAAALFLEGTKTDE
jgi:hypothetical protein